jgi:hypothetical protein
MTMKYREWSPAPIDEAKVVRLKRDRVVAVYSPFAFLRKVARPRDLRSIS